jgi:hypothetical protein
VCPVCYQAEGENTRIPLPRVWEGTIFVEVQEWPFGGSVQSTHTDRSAKTQ